MNEHTKDTADSNFETQIREAGFDMQDKSAVASSDGVSSDDAPVNIEFVDTDTEPVRRRRHFNKRKRKKYMTKKQKFVRGLIATLIILLIILLILLAVFLIIRFKGKNSLLDYGDIELTAPDGLDVDLYDNGKTVIYNGKTYIFNDKITNILFLGIDQFELGTEVYGSAGQADAVYLLAYDTSNGDCALISISRDSMVDIDIYSSSDNYMGTINEQLCLSFAYGDGGAASCQNVITSVSRMFYGIPINSYFAIDISAISPLNDSIGGVTLTVIEDLPGMSTGETVTLMGADAVSYVRYRDTSLLESNALRIERQKQYISAFAAKLIPSIKADISVALDLYNTALDYTVTNIDISRLTYLATIFASKNVNGLGIKSVEGEIIQGEYYAEFYPDETALYELILDTFYNVAD